MNTAERIGVGVGVSLGILFLTIIAFLAWMLHRHTRSSQTREKGNNQVPANFDIKEDLPTQRPDAVNTGTNENQSHVPEQDRLLPEIYELHDIAQRPYSRELHGSPAPHRRELP